MDPAGDMVICFSAFSGVLVVSNIGRNETGRQNIRPGKGKYPLERSISFVPGQARIVFISYTKVIVRGPGSVFKQPALVIRPVIKSLLIDVSARSGVAVSYLYAKTRAV